MFIYTYSNYSIRKLQICNQPKRSKNIFEKKIVESAIFLFYIENIQKKYSSANRRIFLHKSPVPLTTINSQKIINLFQTNALPSLIILGKILIAHLFLLYTFQNYFPKNNMDYHLEVDNF